MKITCLGAMLAIAGASLGAAGSAPAQRATVTVCIETDPSMQEGVRPLVSAMFAGIGIGVAWHELGSSCPAGAGAIQVRLSHDASAMQHSKTEALAFARPNAGTVVVFADRVRLLHGNQARTVMAHVLVHEITHVLEGISHHSPTGIMKDHWDSVDFFEMTHNSLAFAQEDVDLIYAGLKRPRVTSDALVTRR